MAAPGAAVIDLPALYAECAPQVHPATMAAVVRVESGGRELALHVNRWRGPQPRPVDVAEAAAVVRRFVAMGFTVDIGEAQVNTANLPGLGLTIEAALDPCINLRAGAAILTAGYLAAARLVGEGQAALLMGLSAYNSGNFVDGFRSGYVARYQGGWTPRPAGPAPSLARITAPPMVHVTAAVRTAPSNPLTADTTVAWGIGGD